MQGYTLNPNNSSHGGAFGRFCPLQPFYTSSRVCKFVGNSWQLHGYSIGKPDQSILNMSMQRVVIYPKDIVLLTGKSEKYGRRLLKQIKAKLAKEDHQFVTIEEFCIFTGIPNQVVERLIKY